MGGLYRMGLAALTRKSGIHAPARLLATLPIYRQLSRLWQNVMEAASPPNPRHEEACLQPLWVIH